MKKIVAGGIVCILVVVMMFFLFGPEERINAFSEKWKRINKDPAQACFDLFRKKLKDPYSARIISSHWVDFNAGEKEKELHVEYKAKNSYGAYVIDEDFCVIDPDRLDKVRNKDFDYYMHIVEMATINRRLAKELEILTLEEKLKKHKKQ